MRAFLRFLTNLRIPQGLRGRGPLTVAVPVAFLLAALLSVLGATWAAAVVERRSAEGIAEALRGAGYDWASVATDGLIVTLSGTAPTELARFHALSVAGGVVDADRVTDAMDVTDAAALKAPDYKIEILRNGDGISVIGLIPAGEAHERIVKDLKPIAGVGTLTDMMETADHPIPEGWDAAVEFGIVALRALPRSKISIASDAVSVTAISDSAVERAKLETELARQRPEGLKIALDISAPRPVITPFTLRFLIDGDGARFDACSAENEKSRDRILAAAIDAGATGKQKCTIGLGVPTPAWADAVTMALSALKQLGAGSVTFSDADISLIAADAVQQPDFDRVVGELESNLPEVFSLHAVLTPKPDQNATAIVPEFTATLSDKGMLDMRGRLGDELSRDAVESFARARFGTNSVHTAVRIAPDMPKGWPVRVLAALEALGELSNGQAAVREDGIDITGVTGSTDARDTIARILSSKLGDGQKFTLGVRYDEQLDPLLGLPTPEECAANVNKLLAAHKINFEPGAAQIAKDAAGTLDKVADLMKKCPDVPMEVGGHTDSQGGEEMNLELSEKRAEAVIAALMQRRVLTGHLKAIGYGETVPIADNATETGRETNRRIEFRLIADQTGADGTTAGAAVPEAADAGPAADDGAGVDGPMDGADAANDATTMDGADAPMDGADTPTDGGDDPGAAASDPPEAGVEVQDATTDTLHPKLRPANGGSGN
jgi:OmpA-OmpF porin, OOP family